MWNHVCRRGLWVLPVLLALAAGGAARAEDKDWTLRLEPMYMQAFGHDQHVLNIRRFDFDPVPQTERNAGVTLDTGSDYAYRFEFRANRGEWSFGLDSLWFTTAQQAGPFTAAADGAGGNVDEVVFEIADRDFTSDDPGEVLFYEVLEDTDLSIWTVDIYAMKTLVESPSGGLQLQLGLRTGDFDNDYRAVAGRQGVDGTLLGASSNYGRMNGPLVGLAGNVRRGRHTVEGYLGQSVLLGSAELTSMFSDFTGSFSAPTFVSEELLRSDLDVAIPITELRLEWTIRVNRMVAVGLGANTAAWWDIPVPPGVIPGEGGDSVLHENTIVFVGMLGVVELTF